MRGDSPGLDKHDPRLAVMDRAVLRWLLALQKHDRGSDIGKNTAIERFDHTDRTIPA